MLTDKQIRNAIETGKLKIEPFDEKSLKASRYDIRLGKYILIPKNTSKTIDLTNPDVQPEYDKVDITKTGYTLNPGDFVLGQTDELLTLDSDIGIFIDGSTTAARLGLSIHQCSTFIPPGQDAHIITLELLNGGPWKIKLSYKLRIGKLIIFQTSEKNTIPTKVYNRYNGQKETTGAVIKLNNDG